MSHVRHLPLATAWAVALVVVTPLAASAASPPWPLVSSQLPATLHECSTRQESVGGSSYANLWTLTINVVDLEGEKVFTNAKDVSIVNPRLSLNAASSFSGVVAKAFASQRAFIESALAASLKLPRPSSSPKAMVITAGRRHVAAHSSLVMYATSSIDFSQGFFTRVSPGCNARGPVNPWVFSTVAVGSPTYHSIVEPTSSLVNGTYQPPASVPLAFLDRIVTRTNPSSTGPLPAGFGFPKVQTELLRNDKIVSYSPRGSGSVFLGWLRDKLPVANRLEPFSISVVRTGTW
jgi:hypothetical protein